MSMGLRLNGRVIGINPAFPAVLYTDRVIVGAWEAVAITKRDRWFDIRFLAANRQLCVNQESKQFESRPAGDIDGWGGQWDVHQVDGVWLATCGPWTLTIDGYATALPTPGPGALARLHVDTWNFVTDAGVIVPWAHTSGFRDLDRLLRGQDIRPVLAQSEDQGATGRRVFATKWNWAIKVNGRWQDGPDHLWPKEHADYFDQVERLAELYATFHHYLNLVVLVNARSVMPDINEQLAFWNRIIDIARRHPNIILSLMNEGDAHDNAVDIARFPQPDGVLASTGSNGAGANPPRPFFGGPWGFCELHPERRADRPSLGTTTLHFAIHGYQEGGDSWPGTQQVTVASEPYGFDEENEDGRRTNEPQVAWLLGLGCTWGSGGTGLSTDGIESVLLRPKQDACMRLFLAGVKAGRR